MPVNTLSKDDKARFPLYDDLPEPVPGFKCSWAYFNSLCKSETKRDDLGTLNFLTPERRLKALREVRNGDSVSLDLPIDHFAHDSTAFGGRKPPVHQLHSVAPFCYEDSVTMNTQCTSQWDGFRHFGLPVRQEEGSYVFYNNWSGEELEGNDEIGTDAWLKSGGIVGRGVLLDFARWAEHRGEEVNVNLGRLITLADIQSILEYQQTMVHPGDILIIRTGWLQWYNHTCPQERHFELCSCHSPGTHAFIGIEASKNFVAWLWNNQIAAVAGDQVAFESTPPPATGFGSLHQHLLAALGCPMGELWNTETLAKACEKRERWSFLLTSAPLHIRGGVASPANAVAVL